jgi:hypothetical protein
MCLQLQDIVMWAHVRITWWIFSSSHYTASSDGVTGQHWVGKYTKGSGPVLIWGTSSSCSGLRAEIWTGCLPNTKQGCHPLNLDVRWVVLWNRLHYCILLPAVGPSNYIVALSTLTISASLPTQCHVFTPFNLMGSRYAAFSVIPRHCQVFISISLMYIKYTCKGNHVIILVGTYWVPPNVHARKSTS